jgi:hypothetical protein
LLPTSTSGGGFVVLTDAAADDKISVDIGEIGNEQFEQRAVVSIGKNGVTHDAAARRPRSLKHHHAISGVATDTTSSVGCVESVESHLNACCIACQTRNTILEAMMTL